MLIAWSRLLDGRWRDPLVGRDLLIGGVLGVAWQLIDSLKSVARGMRGGLPGFPADHTDGWMGSRLALAELLSRVPQGIWLALGVVLLLVLLRIVLRRELAASAVVVVVLVALAANDPGDRLVNILFAFIFFVTMVAIATRFGLLMFVAFLLIETFSGLTDGLRTPEFATGALVLTLVAMVAPGVFGFYTATRGRRASGWLDA
jgi:serine/threonine-protein kinase